MEQLRSIFLDKKDYRKNELFSLLKTSELECLSTEAYTDYKYSRKTFRADILELKEDLLEVYGTDLFSSQGPDSFKIDTSHFIASNKLFLFYLEKSRNFETFNFIVQHAPQTFKFFQSMFFYSQSAIYQSLNQLNKSFESLSLKFSLSGIEGDERTIRHVLFRVYWIAFGGVKWPFEIDREFLLNEVNKGEIIRGKLSEFERERLLYWLAITVLRIKKGLGVLTNKSSKSESLSSLFEGFLTTVCPNLSPEVSVQDEVRFFTDTIASFDNQEMSLEPFEELVAESSIVERWKSIRISEKESVSVSIHNRLEELLLEEALSKGWQPDECRHLVKQLNKIRYYIEENLLDYYYFVTPSNETDYREQRQWVSSELKNLLDQFPNRIASVYIFECTRLGLMLTKPLRIRVHSKDGNALQLKSLLQKQVVCSIELEYRKEFEADVLFTDLLSEYQLSLSSGQKCIFYEFPLVETKIIDSFKDVMGYQ